MGSRHRYLRTVYLISLIVLFSMSLIGQTDGRLHIGGFVWNGEEDPQIDSNLMPVAKVDSTGSAGSNEITKVDQFVNERPSSVIDVIAGGLGTDARLELFSQEISTGMLKEETKKGDLLSGAGHQEVLDGLTNKVAVTALPDQQRPVPQDERERPPIHIHTVSSGETLWDIARAYGITVDSILSSNDITNSNRIRVGQELEILTVRGVLHPVAYGESLWEIAERYQVSMNEIILANGISDASKIQPQDRLVIPGATRVLIKDVLVIKRQLQRAFDWPLLGRISSPFGTRVHPVTRVRTMHNGIDIAVPSGTTIRASADGRVTYSGYNGGYGNLVIIDHGDGIETRYAHNSRNHVRAGERVTRGQIIAVSGSTGVVTGPHLHFEIRYRQQPVDPRLYLKN